MKFNYKARTQEGKIETGIIDAPSLEGAILILRSRKLIITSLEPALKQLSTFQNFLGNLLHQVKGQEVVVMSRQLAILIQAKVPLVQSLRTLTHQTANPYLVSVLESVADEVDAGTVFSKALSQYPKVFSEFYINMVKSGEVSGRLEDVLIYLSDYLEREYYLTSQVRSALIYPAFVLGGFVIVAIIMLIFVIPTLTSVLAESGQTLPLVTRILIGASNFIRSWGWLLFIILLAVVGFLWWQIKTNEGARYNFDNFLLKMPIFGELLKKIYLARMAETLSTLSSAGISINQSLQIASDVVGNLVYRSILIEANEVVRRGGTINSTLEKYPKVVLPMVSQMVAIGEQTGKLDAILKNISDFFGKEVDRALRNIVDLIEPILIVVLGLGVAGLVAAILIPMYNLTSGF